MTMSRPTSILPGRDIWAPICPDNYLETHLTRIGPLKACKMSNTTTYATVLKHLITVDPEQPSYNADNNTYCIMLILMAHALSGHGYDWMNDDDTWKFILYCKWDSNRDEKIREAAAAYRHHYWQIRIDRVFKRKGGDLIYDYHQDSRKVAEIVRAKLREHYVPQWLWNVYSTLSPTTNG